MLSKNHFQIKKVYFLFLLTHLYLTQFSQVKITVYNRSSATIDSVVVELKNPLKIGPIAPGDSKSFFVSVYQANFHSFVPFHLSVYSSVLNQRMQWHKSGFIDTLYYFDHGLSKEDKEPKQPEEFTLYVSNRAFAGIDTVFASNNAIKEITESRPRGIHVILDHKLADIEKAVHFRIGETILTANLKDFNFNDWTDYGAVLYIYDDSILKSRRENAKIFEFVIDFDIEDRSWGSKDDELWKRVKVESKHLLKTYAKNNGGTITAVFDHEKFIADPRFTIKIGRKTYHMNWEKELDKQTEYRQVFISGNKIQTSW